MEKNKERFKKILHDNIKRIMFDFDQDVAVDMAGQKVTLNPDRDVTELKWMLAGVSRDEALLRTKATFTMIIECIEGMVEEVQGSMIDGMLASENYSKVKLAKKHEELVDADEVLASADKMFMKGVPNDFHVYKYRLIIDTFYIPLLQKRGVPIYIPGKDLLLYFSLYIGHDPAKARIYKEKAMKTDFKRDAKQIEWDFNIMEERYA